MSRERGIDVCAWGLVVGRVEEGEQGSMFTPSENWLGQGAHLNPLEDLFVESEGIPTWLTDSLPDEFGRRLIAQALRQDGLIPQDQELASLGQELAWLGDRAIGALEFAGARRGQAGCREPLDISALVGQANGWLTQGRDYPGSLKELIEVGCVAGGQRAKGVVALDPRTGLMYPERCANADPSLEHWLIKFDGVVPARKGGELEPGSPLGWGRVEYAYYLMASQAGIPMSPCRLYEENGRAHFMTKRFDRVGGTRVHQVSLCALAGMDYTLIGQHSYDGLFDVIERLGLGVEARQQAFAQMAFNVLAQNNDDHTKNFAFQLWENGRWSLAKGYDISYAYHPNSHWVSQHLMGVNGKFKGIGIDDVASVAQDWVVEDYEHILDKVIAAVRRWPEFAMRAGVEGARLEEIKVSLERY